MSQRKAKENKKKNKQVNSEENAKNKEPISKYEKIFYTVIIASGIIAILLIIIFSIPKGGEKEKIANKFDSLTTDNVFEYIEFDEIKKKQNDGETFDVLLINTKQKDCNYFVYCVDYIVKGRIASDLNSPEVIYIFNTSKIKDEEKAYFKDMENKKVFDGPTLFHFEKAEGLNNSVNEYVSSRLKLEKYENNYYEVIKKYFDLSYSNEEN